MTEPNYQTMTYEQLDLLLRDLRIKSAIRQDHARAGKAKREELSISIQSLRKEESSMKTRLDSCMKDVIASRYVLDTYNLHQENHPELSTSHLTLEQKQAQGYLKQHQQMEEDLYHMKNTLREFYKVMYREEEIVEQLRQEAERDEVTYQKILGVWNVFHEVHLALVKQVEMEKEARKCATYILNNYQRAEHHTDISTLLDNIDYTISEVIIPVFEETTEEAIMKHESQFVIGAAYVLYFIDESFDMVIKNIIRTYQFPYIYGITREVAEECDMIFPGDDVEEGDIARGYAVIPEWVWERWENIEREKAEYDNGSDTGIDYEDIIGVGFFQIGGTSTPNNIRKDTDFYQEFWKFQNSYGFNLDSRLHFYQEHHAS